MTDKNGQFTAIFKTDKLSIYSNKLVTESQTTGNASTRIDCAIIALRK